LLDQEGINWTGAAWDKGAAVVPLADGNPLRAVALREVATIEQQLQHASTSETVAVMLYRLQGHYWQQGMTEALAREVARDYLRLLTGFPDSIWRAACDQCLLDSDRKFFPKVGEMKALLESRLAAQRWRLRKLKALTGTK
jgi:hypothetical protein